MTGKQRDRIVGIVLVLLISIAVGVFLLSSKDNVTTPISEPQFNQQGPTRGSAASEQQRAQLAQDAAQAARAKTKQPVIAAPEQPAIPDLIGKDYDGVVALMGRQPDWTGHDTPGGNLAYEWMRWRYDKTPFPGYKTEIHFEQFPPHPVTKSFKTVHWIIVSLAQDEFDGDNSQSFAKVRDVVPAKVLNEQPLGIYIGWPGGASKVCVVVIWHLNGRTYCLEAADSSRVPWQEERKVDSNGQLMAITTLTEQAKEFRDFDRAWLFYQIDSQPKLFGLTINLFKAPDNEGSLYGTKFYKSPYSRSVPQY